MARARLAHLHAAMRQQHRAVGVDVHERAGLPSAASVFGAAGAEKQAAVPVHMYRLDHATASRGALASQYGCATWQPRRRVITTEALAQSLAPLTVLVPPCVIGALRRGAATPRSTLRCRAGARLVQELGGEGDAKLGGHGGQAALAEAAARASGQGWGTPTLTLYQFRQTPPTLRPSAGPHGRLDRRAAHAVSGRRRKAAFCAWASVRARACMQGTRPWAAAGDEARRRPPARLAALQDLPKVRRVTLAVEVEPADGLGRLADRARDVVHPHLRHHHGLRGAGC